MIKLALLVGIVYNGTENQLNGCINDVVAMGAKLQKTYGYNNITIITDNTPLKPTKKNIINEIKKIVEESIKCKEIFFHYSGHGSREYDRTGDEKDGMDELLVPLDYKTSGFITDDELKELFFFSRCPVKVIFDCCHSGSGLDLTYNGRMVKGRFQKFQESKVLLSKPPIVMLSACLDEEVSWDVYLSDKKKYMGALTSTFLKETENFELTMKTEDISLDQLLLLIYMGLIKSGYIQRPVISSNKPLNVEGIFISKNTDYVPLIEKEETIVAPTATTTVLKPRKKTGGCCIQ